MITSLRVLNVAIKCSSNGSLVKGLLYLLALTVGLFLHLAEHLKLHHKLNAGD